MYTSESPELQQAGPQLETIEAQTGPQPQWSVIWLHGLGADGHDFAPIVPQLGLPADPALRFIFPHAPVRPVTINNGIAMRAWYDIVGFDTNRDQDQQGIAQSAAAVNTLIRRESQRGIPPQRVILAGFSQGGAMALHVGLRHADKLAGIIALSCYLLFPGADGAQLRQSRETPCFVAHGNMDPVVPFPLGDAAGQRLQALGFPLTWRSYSMDHSVCLEEINDIGDWMRTVIQSGG